MCSIYLTSKTEENAKRYNTSTTQEGETSGVQRRRCCAPMATTMALLHTLGVGGIVRTRANVFASAADTVVELANFVCDGQIIE